MNISDRLNELAKVYDSEARKCLRARAYLGASVMQVAAFEAGLQAMCFVYPEDVKKTSVYQRKRFRGRKNRALEFSLYQPINIAAELSWFPPKLFTWAGKRASIAGFSHEVRKVRNVVHPGEWGRKEWETMKFTKGLYQVVYEVFDVANS